MIIKIRQSWIKAYVNKCENTLKLAISGKESEEKKFFEHGTKEHNKIYTQLLLGNIPDNIVPAIKHILPETSPFDYDSSAEEHIEHEAFTIKKKPEDDTVIITGTLDWHIKFSKERHIVVDWKFPGSDFLISDYRDDTQGS